MTIFLSYSRKDEPVVKVLAQGFEAAHKEIWYDQDLMGGDSWWDTILKKIRSATVFIFVLSEDALHSKPCLAELKYAEDLDRSVVPVRVGPVTSLRATPLAGRQVIEFRPENALSSFAIFAAVEEASQNQRPLPDPLPAPPAIPYEYLQRLARQIESTELNQAQQFAVVDQLRRAITEETDDAVRHDVLDMLQNLMSKPWSTRRTEGEVRFILLANGTPEQSQAEPPQTAQPERKTEREPPQVSTPHQEHIQAQQHQPIPPDTPEPDGRHVIPEQPVATYRHRQDGDSRSPAETGLDAKEQAASIVEPQMATHMTPTADSANHPPPAPFWPDVSTPPMPPSAPPQPAEESLRTERTAVAYATQPLPKQLFPTPQPPENWILSFVAVLFFFGFGAIALYFSYQVGQRYWAGNLAGATKASKLSRAWAIAGILVGSLITTWLLIQR